MRKLLIPISFLCLSGLPAGAQQEQPKALPDPKPAWQWTDDERFAARFAPGAAKSRLNGPVRRTSDSDSTAHEPVFLDVVNGRTDPHLFFPIELFRDFLDGVIEAPDHERKPIEIAVIAASLDHANAILPSDWRPLLERDTAEYRSLRRQYGKEIADLSAQRPRGGPAQYSQDWVERLRLLQQSKTLPLCRAVHKALTRVRTDLGPAGFQSLLMFLYGDIAPQMAIISDSDDPNWLSARRQFLFGSCQ